MSEILNNGGDGVSNRNIVEPEMCYYCFDVLYSHLYNERAPKTPSFLNGEFPLFVTWTTGKEKRLRGCIGTFSAIKLHQGIKEYAISSAFSDSRFNPISIEELPNLNVSISLLINFEDGVNYLDWVIGIHGIRIEFQDENGRKYNSTYLPEVAPEQGWDKLQAIDSLMRKGGYKGTITNKVRMNIRLTRYQSEKITVTYQDYLDNRK